MPQNFSIKILVQSVVEDSHFSYGFTEYILIGELSKHVVDDELIADEKLLSEIKVLVEDAYVNALGQPLSQRLVKIVDSADFDSSVIIPKLTVVMQYPYLFREPILLDEFLKLYEIGANID